MQEVYEEKTVIRKEYPREYALLARIIYYIADIIEILLGFRFLLRAFGAGGSPFVEFIYGLSRPLVAPFLGIFPPADAGGFVIEWGTLLAMLVYLLLAMLLVRLLRIIFTP